MAETEDMVQFLTPEGELAEQGITEEYRPYIDALSDDDLRTFHRDMVINRALDVEAENLQRQGQMALWPPNRGQEAAQVGSARAAKRQDHIFPAYREHAVARIRGLDPLMLIEMMRGNSHGGWDPAATNNFHLYTLVIGSHALHATGYAMGIGLDGKAGTGDPERDEAVMVYFGDGATSQGDVSEAFVFAASYQTPQVFFLQNNHWAISVPVSVQSRIPLYLRSRGFGIPSVQVDGNDVLASYAVSAKLLDDARSGRGPSLIEALTYRMGAHTTSDDPTKYRSNDEAESWLLRDPITRFEAYLRRRGESEEFFAQTAEEAADLAADVRRRTLALEAPPLARAFEHVYTEPHPVTAAQQEWLRQYEASLGGEA
ncbi:thiamine pyrophosphate-dependent dehydrogenase E1 component subunit alpha [Salinibacterium sp. SYSU T00001]|uniref:thiamine pyrophosphate-dependent dehydrogenase E1 component subunit alpha n=1 Tax=Homoserinimonas sedimenticola TaxID=2986805 RepID=UPI00223638F8|nr:thiamine pyrophosphate-dependent dehydrogenase E1 component subunit alpha [Salinibacterium sedimenticola]MCW4385776.1 thiamine pyrophosphate-dependent dehydrogenase E1 component subunit alpha [Salinibacterium sedimenticola]